MPQLIIGSGQFIPGFEEQLKGAKKGETRTLEVTFPEDYQAAELKGKAATFETTVKDIQAPVDTVVDDAMAQSLGLEDLKALRDILKTQLDNQYNQASRFKMKRALLDLLDEKHDFALPKRMLEAEFSGIWAQVEQDKQSGEMSDEDKGKSDEELKSEYNENCRTSRPFGPSLSRNRHAKERSGHRPRSQ